MENRGSYLVPCAYCTAVFIELLIASFAGLGRLRCGKYSATHLSRDVETGPVHFFLRKTLSRISAHDFLSSLSIVFLFTKPTPVSRSNDNILHGRRSLLAQTQFCSVMYSMVVRAQVNGHLWLRKGFRLVTVRSGRRFKPKAMLIAVNVVTFP